MSVVNLLRRLSLFADLRGEELNALSRCLGKRTFASDMILYHKGSPARNFYIIESGEVRIFSLSDSGHEITLEVYGPGDASGRRPCSTGTCAPPAP